jgi:hypothetical protein
VSDQDNRKHTFGNVTYTERRQAPHRDKPGVVEFDDRGNAQYQWRDERMLDETEVGEKRRQRALSVANLVLVDDEPPPDLKVAHVNKQATRLGYNPYESGQIQKTQRRKPVDLRALSKWIEAKKNLPNNSDEE